jgi:hypothetical protein
VKFIKQIIHAFKFGVRIFKNSSWSTDAPDIKIGKFRSWKVNGMNIGGGGVSYITKCWLIAWGKDTYSISVVKPWRTRFYKVTAR